MGEAGHLECDFSFCFLAAMTQAVFFTQALHHAILMFNVSAEHRLILQKYEPKETSSPLSCNCQVLCSHNEESETGLKTLMDKLR